MINGSICDSRLRIFDTKQNKKTTNSKPKHRPLYLLMWQPYNSFNRGGIPDKQQFPSRSVVLSGANAASRRFNEVKSHVKITPREERASTLGPVRKRCPINTFATGRTANKAI